MASKANFSTMVELMLTNNPGVSLAGLGGPVPPGPYSPSIIDRGDCESATPPAMKGQTTNTLSNCTFAQSAVQHRGGANSYLFTKTAGAGTAATAYLHNAAPTIGNFNGMTPGHFYSLSCYFLVPASGFNSLEPYVSIGYTDYTGVATVENRGYWSGATGTWVTVNCSLYIPLNAVGAFVYFGTIAAAAANTFYVDDISMYDLAQTPMLAGATLGIYDGVQPQCADYALSGNNLCASFTFPANPRSLIVPTGSIPGMQAAAAGTGSLVLNPFAAGNPSQVGGASLYVLDRLPAAVFLISSMATFARCTNTLGMALFDCSVDNILGTNSNGVAPDLALNQNPFIAGELATISLGNKASPRFFSSPGGRTRAGIKNA